MTELDKRDIVIYLPGKNVYTKKPGKLQKCIYKTKIIEKAMTLMSGMAFFGDTNL